MKALLRKTILAAIITLLALGGAHAAVWEAERDWTEEDNDLFVDWVVERFNKDFFHDPEEKALFGLALDCSDAIYAMRAIFAYEHRLPFVINDPRGRKTPLTNETTKWDGYRPTLREELDDGSWRSYKGPEYTEKQKLRAFINYLSDTTSTVSLVRDTYPVALKDIKPGDMFLLPRNHAYIIKSIDPATGAMTTLSHSSPRAWRMMSEINDFPAEVPQDKKRRDGYRRFKPVEHLKTAAEKVPGASTEQWETAKKLDSNRAAFALATQTALASEEEPLDAKASRLFASLCDYSVQRVGVVNDALNFLSNKEANGGGSCMNIGQYAEYSTPSRDAKLEGKYRVLAAMIDEEGWEDTEFEEKEAIEAIFAEKDLMSEEDIGVFCAVPFDIRGGRNLSLRELWRGLEAGRLVSDPHAPMDARWGLDLEKWTPSCKSAIRS